MSPLLSPILPDKLLFSAPPALRVPTTGNCPSALAAKWAHSPAIFFSLFFFLVLELKPEISHILGKCSTNLIPDPFLDNLKKTYVHV